MIQILETGETGLLSGWPRRDVPCSHNPIVLPLGQVSTEQTAAFEPGGRVEGRKLGSHERSIPRAYHLFDEQHIDCRVRD